MMMTMMIIYLHQNLKFRKNQFKDADVITSPLLMMSTIKHHDFGSQVMMKIKKFWKRRFSKM